MTSDQLLEELGTLLGRCVKVIRELEAENAELKTRREWQGLTRLEILKTANDAAPPEDLLWERDPDQCVVVIARAIESKLKEKNT